MNSHLRKIIDWLDEETQEKINATLVEGWDLVAITIKQDYSVWVQFERTKPSRSFAGKLKLKVSS